MKQVSTKNLEVGKKYCTNSNPDAILEFVHFDSAKDPWFKVIRGFYSKDENGLAPFFKEGHIWIEIEN
jgi:hypothetical protein